VGVEEVKPFGPPTPPGWGSHLSSSTKNQIEREFSSIFGSSSCPFNPPGSPDAPPTPPPFDSEYLS